MNTRKKELPASRYPVVLFCGFLVLLAVWPLRMSAQFQYDSTAFQSDEVLTYKVKWSFLRLGTLTVRQEYADPAFPRFMQVWINGESAAGLPFIDVYFRSTSLLDVNDPTNILYELITDRESRHHTSYIYDRMNQRLLALETMLGDILRLDTLEAPVPYYDGPGLFMFARCASGSDTTILLPTVMSFEIGATSIRFSGTAEPVEITAFEHELPAYRFEGTTTWEGTSFAGMSGDFSGWVSADSTRRVLKARVGISLGSVTIELESVGVR